LSDVVPASSKMKVWPVAGHSTVRVPMRLLYHTVQVSRPGSNPRRPAWKNAKANSPIAGPVRTALRREGVDGLGRTGQDLTPPVFDLDPTARNSTDVQPARPPVVVFGTDHPSALGIVQSLGRIGVRVVAVDTHANARGFGSRYVESRHVIGPGLEDAWALLERLRPGGGLLMATNDHYLTAIAQRAESLAESFVVPVPPWAVLGPLLRRTRSLELASEAGLRVPRYWAFSDAREMDAAIAMLDPESQYLVCRADFSRPCVVDTTGWGRSIKVSGPGAAAIRRDCHDVVARTGQHPVIVEIVPGASEAAVGVVALVDRTHEVVLSYCLRRRPLCTAQTGSTFVHPYSLGWQARCESTLDPEAEAAARALLRHVRYFGVAAVEFRRDARDGELVFVKLDMRVDRAVRLSTALGLDIPRATYELFALGRKPAVPVSYAAGTSWLWLSRYLDDLTDNRTRVAFGRELMDLAASARRTRAVAYLGRGDLRPFLTDLGRWARVWARRGRGWIGRRLGLLRQSAP
jgi:D-aspartate ligase